MTITEAATIRAMRTAFEQRLDAAYNEMRKDYGIVSGARIAYECGCIAFEWGWSMVAQIAAQRFNVGVKP